MIGQRQLNMEDYLALLRRRIWLLLIPSILGPLAGYGVTFFLQEQYRSQTLVLVESQKVPEKYVTSVASDDLNERLATMQEQILSRTRLQPLIEKFALYKEEQKRVPMEDLVDRLRGSIRVNPVRAMSGTQSGGLPGFYISVTDENARRAQSVCAEITSLFMDQNLKLREQRAEGTTEFLAKQLEEAQRELNEQDAKLAAFKRRYMGQLPDSSGANLGILNSMMTQLESVNQAITRAQQDKTYLNSMLSQQIAAWQSTKDTGSPESLQQQLAAMQAELVKMQAKYTSNHPDIVTMKKNIADVQKKIDDAAAAEKDKPEEKTNTKATVQESPGIQNLRAQIYIQDQTIREKTHDQERLQQQIRDVQARIQLTPTVEQEYKELTRGYDTALGFYNTLLAKKNDSEMATELERRQQGEQFRVMDPANFPEKPYYPDRRFFALGGLGGGMALGTGIVLLLELRDKAIRTDRDVEALLGLPTLAMVPALGGGNGKKSSFWKRTPPSLEKPEQGVRA